MSILDNPEISQLYSDGGNVRAALLRCLFLTTAEISQLYSDGGNVWAALLRCLFLTTLRSVSYIPMVVMFGLLC